MKAVIAIALGLVGTGSPALATSLADAIVAQDQIATRLHAASDACSNKSLDEFLAAPSSAREQGLLQECDPVTEKATVAAERLWRLCERAYMHPVPDAIDARAWRICDHH